MQYESQIPVSSALCLKRTALQPLLLIRKRLFARSILSASEKNGNRMRNRNHMQRLTSILVAAEIVLLITLLSGCGVTSDVVRFDSTHRPATVDSKVEVLLEKPARPHKVIARIQIGPDILVDDYQSQTNEVIKRAAEMGADAVIFSYGSEVVGSVAGGYGATSEYKITVGQVIVYESDAKPGN